MGNWYYLINYTKSSYIFLGRGPGYFSKQLSAAIRVRDWSLNDNLAIIGDYIDPYFKDSLTGFTSLYYNKDTDSFDEDEDEDTDTDEDTNEDTDEDLDIFI
jgi:hypothetical protein